MSITSRIPTDHKQITFTQGVLERQPSPFFAPPYPSGMRNPGTMWETIVTAQGPHDTENPGLGGGVQVPVNKNWAVQNQYPATPLTRKGG